MAELPKLLDTALLSAIEQQTVWVLRRAPRFDQPAHAALFEPIRTTYDGGGIDALSDTDKQLVRVLFEIQGGAIFDGIDRGLLSNV